MDVCDFVVNKGNGIKDLVDNGFEHLPEIYIQPLEKRFDGSKALSQVSIPIIDVSNLNDPKVAESICEAASKWGFFQIINHGIPLEVLEDLKDSAHGFFGLPIEERRKYLKGNSSTDTVFLSTSFSPHKEAVLEWRDHLSFRYFSGDDEAYALWPPVCKGQVVEHMKRTEFLIKRLLEVLLKKLNVKEIDKAREYTTMGELRITFNYYPKCLNPELTAGIPPHSDLSTFTVLLQDKISGLYVRGMEGDNSWIHVPPIKGALVINVGDVLQIMSNDKYRSVEHRVVANKSNNRVSIPIFVNPGPDTVIGPLPEALESGEKPIYKEIVYSDYFQYYFSKCLDGKKAMDFVKI